MTESFAIEICRDAPFDPDDEEQESDWAHARIHIHDFEIHRFEYIGGGNYS
jgi:hypothetical protein